MKWYEAFLFVLAFPFIMISFLVAWCFLLNNEDRVYWSRRIERMVETRRRARLNEVVS